MTCAKASRCVMAMATQPPWRHMRHGARCTTWHASSPTRLGGRIDDHAEAGENGQDNSDELDERPLGDRRHDSEDSEHLIGCADYGGGQCRERLLILEAKGPS